MAWQGGACRFQRRRTGPLFLRSSGKAWWLNPSTPHPFKFSVADQDLSSFGRAVMPGGLTVNPSTLHPLKASVGVLGNADLLEIQGLFTHGWRTHRTFGEVVGGYFLKMDDSDWSNVIRHIPSIPDPTLRLSAVISIFKNVHSSF